MNGLRGRMGTPASCHCGRGGCHDDDDDDDDDDCCGGGIGGGGCSDGVDDEW